MEWKDNIANVWQGQACFPMDNCQRLYSDGLNILKFILERFTLMHYSEGTKWHVPNEDE